MTPEELQAIRERAEAATPGPWEPFENLGLEIVSVSPGTVVARMMAASTHWRGDTYFIAHARADIPALLDHIAALETENARLRERAHNLLAAIESAHEQGELSQRAMLRLNTPGALMRRAIQRDQEAQQ